MITTLHLTNGTAIIPSIREAGIAGHIVAWDDVLHEGPVESGLNPAALRERRAAYLASCGWANAVDIARDLAARDAALAEAMSSVSERRSAVVDEIVLWFEPDLFDQLQRLQILDRLPIDGPPRVTAVPDNESLGLLPASRFLSLFDERRAVTSAQRMAARDGWTAFRAPDPRAILEVLPRVSVLSHMSAALVRHLQQFPSIDRGLSRTEQQALEVVASGVTRVSDVYRQSHHAREEAIFMGDAPFLVHLGALLRASLPLLRSTRGARDLALDDEITLTDAGRNVLVGEADRVALCGIDRWLGGVRLSGNGPVWRWDHGRQTLRFA